MIARAGPSTTGPTGCALTLWLATSSSAARRHNGSINPDAVLREPRGMPQATRALWSPKIGRDRCGAKRPEIILMKRVLLLAASALVLTAFVPEQPDAQGRRFGVRAGVGRGPVIVGRGRVYGYPRGYYGLPARLLRSRRGRGGWLRPPRRGGPRRRGRGSRVRLGRRPLPSPAAGHRRVGQCPVDVRSRVLEADGAVHEERPAVHRSVCRNAGSRVTRP